MTYLRDKKHNMKQILITGVFVAILVYVILFTRVFDVTSKGVGFIAVPIWKTQDLIVNTWDNIRIGFISKKSILVENEQLKEDAIISSAKLLDRNLLFEENMELKELLGREVTEQTVFATVLTKPNRSIYDTLIIDVGENAGITKGDKVLYGGTIVIGEIVEVFKNSSKILLLSSPGEVIDVVVGNSNIETLAYGRGGGVFELELPRDTEVAVGDVVSVPGIISRVLGTVEHVETKPSNPFQTVLFKGPVNIFKLKWVEVIVG